MEYDLKCLRPISTICFIKKYNGLTYKWAATPITHCEEINDLAKLRASTQLTIAVRTVNVVYY